MAVPKKKTSPSRRRMRRAHDALPANASSTCKSCGELKAPHCVCKACGAYNGKQVVSKKEA